MSAPDPLNRLSETVWELPPSFKPGMQVPVRVFADEELIETMDDAVFDQAANVATLPGIVGYSFCMPDGHRGRSEEHTSELSHTHHSIRRWE